MTQGRFKDIDFVIAGIAYGGLTLMILGGMLTAFGTIPTATGNVYLWFGLILLAIGTTLWMFIKRPWLKFDDLQTPYYTGHHDEHVADEHHSEESYATEPVHSEAEQLIRSVVTMEPVITSGSSEQKMDSIQEVDARNQAMSASMDAHHQRGTEQPPVDFRRATDEVPAIKGILPIGGTEGVATPGLVPTPAPFPTLDPKMETANDDLQRLEGIGKKIAEALYIAGITSYAQLASMTGQELEATVKQQGVRLLPGAAESWSKQAQFLVDGDVAGFKAYQATLKGGRTSGDD